MVRYKARDGARLTPQRRIDSEDWMEGFRWHPKAQLFGPGEDAIPAFVPAGPASAACGDRRPDRPADLALMSAFGGPFRIGDEQAPAPSTGFETLTSGSTAAPRRIARSFRSWTTSFSVNAGLFRIGPGVRVAVLGRLVQSLALYGATEGISLGAEVHLLDGMRPDRQRAALAKRRIQVLWAGPAQMHQMLDAGGPVLHDLRWLLIGGAKLGTDLRAALADLCPKAAIREFYGAAEASFVTLADAETPDQSVGRAYPAVQIELRDANGAAADQGQVWVNSPYLFRAYAGADPGPAVWETRAGARWLGLGDIARWDGPHLTLLGRTDRMVTVAGHNVFPEAVEAFMAGLPMVRQGAVLVRPDALRGHVLEAVVRGDATAEADLLAALRAKFGPLTAPRRVIWRADWPLLPSGKPDLVALRAEGRGAVGNEYGGSEGGGNEAGGKG